MSTIEYAEKFDKMAGWTDKTLSKQF